MPVDDLTKDVEQFLNGVFEDRSKEIAFVIREALADEVAKRSSAEVIRVKIVETRHNSCISGAIA